MCRSECSVNREPSIISAWMDIVPAERHIGRSLRILNEIKNHKIELGFSKIPSHVPFACSICPWVSTVFFSGHLFFVVYLVRPLNYSANHFVMTLLLQLQKILERQGTILPSVSILCGILSKSGCKLHTIYLCQSQQSLSGVWCCIYIMSQKRDTCICAGSFLWYPGFYIL